MFKLKTKTTPLWFLCAIAHMWPYMPIYGHRAEYPDKFLLFVLSTPNKFLQRFCSIAYSFIRPSFHVTAKAVISHHNLFFPLLGTSLLSMTKWYLLYINRDSLNWFSSQKLPWKKNILYFKRCQPQCFEYWNDFYLSL